MIPAILSCVFVIYLYHTLKQSSSPENAGSTSVDASAADSDAILRRLHLLQDRIEKLTAGQHNSGGKQ
jgi:hypothetical protein